MVILCQEVRELHSLYVYGMKRQERGRGRKNEKKVVKEICGGRGRREGKYGGNEEEKGGEKKENIIIFVKCLLLRLFLFCLFVKKKSDRIQIIFQQIYMTHNCRP